MFVRRNIVGKKLNLIGKRFGRLLVLKESMLHKRGKIFWECICDCGNKTTVVGVSLKNGNTKSCGCLCKEKLIKFNKQKTLNLAGRYFGRLLVLEEVGRNKRRQSLWKCLCICGNETVVVGEYLKNGSVKSCGCLRREYIMGFNKEKIPDFVGQRFGRLVVLKKIYTNKNLLWLCLCDCGNETNVSTSNLNNNSTRSCGCLKREKRIKWNKQYPLKGENSPSWRGGVSCYSYCDIWRDGDYKESIKERDNYRCSNPDCRKISKKLTIHHIDYNKKSCGPENLITLCDSCNSRANFDREWHEAWYKAIMYRRYGYKYEL